VGLLTDFVCGRHTDIEVFEEHSMDRMALVIIGASHLRKGASFVPEEDWRVLDLMTPDWQILDASVQEKILEIEQVTAEIELDKAVVVLQLYDNSVYMYMAGGPGGVKHLPASDTAGLYHIDGPLLLAVKAGVKDLTAKLFSLIKALGASKKLVLLPLGRYWCAPS
jgi:hypothetical protein